MLNIKIAILPLVSNEMNELIEINPNIDNFFFRINGDELRFDSRYALSNVEFRN